MKAYVINLDSRPDRWEHCLKQANDGGFALTRIPAVDGRDPDYVATLPDRAPGPISGRVLSATEAACFESHRKAWQAIVESGETHGVVLEDDMIYAKGFAACLQDGWVPPEADIVKLETWGWRIYMDSVSVGALGPVALHRLRSTHIGGGGYVLSVKAASRLLTVTEAFTDPVDHVFFDTRSALFDSFTTLQAVPALVIQGGRQESTHIANWAQSTLEVGRADVGSSQASSILSHFSIAKKLRAHLAAYWQAARATLKGQRFQSVPFR